jgi:hypothetical protein
MAKLVSRIRQNGSDLKQPQAVQQTDSTNSTSSTALGSILIVLLIAGAVYVVMGAIALQHS